MNNLNFSKQLPFDLDNDDDLDLFEYFHLSRCAVMEVLDQKEREPSAMATEVASLIATAVARLDRRHGRAAWSSTVIAYADIFFEGSREKPVRSPKAILNLYPNVYDNGPYDDTLICLKKPRLLAAGESLRQLTFDESSCQLDFFETYALCRAFVRQEIRAGLGGASFDLRSIFAIIAPVIEAMDEGMGEEWVERVEEAIWPRGVGRASGRERIARLFPGFRQLGLVREAVAAWDEVSPGGP